MHMHMHQQWTHLRILRSSLRIPATPWDQSHSQAAVSGWASAVGVRGHPGGVTAGVLPTTAPSPPAISLYLLV